jgi:hypothetical protein
MRNQQIVLFFFASLMAASGASAQTLDWQAVEKISPGTRILVKTQQQTYCLFQKASDEKLFCDFIRKSASPQERDSDLTFFRKDVRDVQITGQIDRDGSKDFLTMMAAVGGGGGWDSTNQSNAFAGVKVALLFPLSLDLQYDRIQGHSGFSTEGSAVIPLFRVPGFQPFSKKNFVRVYAEPGVGYRAGGAPFGGYSSAKVLALLWIPPRNGDWSPYIEFQRRFPFESPLQGDNRITIGVMVYSTYTEW